MTPEGGPVTPAFTTGTGQTDAVVGPGEALAVGDGSAEGVAVASGVDVASAVELGLGEAPPVACAVGEAEGPDDGGAGVALALGECVEPLEAVAEASGAGPIVVPAAQPDTIQPYNAEKIHDRTRDIGAIIGGLRPERA